VSHPSLKSPNQKDRPPTPLFLFMKMVAGGRSFTYGDQPSFFLLLNIRGRFFFFSLRGGRFFSLAEVGGGGVDGFLFGVGVGALSFFFSRACRRLREWFFSKKFAWDGGYLSSAA